MSEWLTRSLVGRVVAVTGEALARRWTLSRRVDVLAAQVESIQAQIELVRLALDRIECKCPDCERRRHLEPYLRDE